MAAVGDRNGQSVSTIRPALMIGALVFSTKRSGRLGRYPLGAMGMIVYLFLFTVPFTKGLVKVNSSYNSMFPRQSIMNVPLRGK